MQLKTSFALVLMGNVLVGGGLTNVNAATFADAQFHEKLIAGKLNPTQMEFAPDGRLFVNFKDGAVRIIKKDSLLPKPFAKVITEVTEEQGLIGITFHPKFPDSPWVYVYYTVPDGAMPRHNRISRFQANGDTAIGGEKILFDSDPSYSAADSHPIHVSGGLHFSPKDGKLYLAIGNTSKDMYSQSMTLNLGKILRFNPDGTIPTDNPFYATATGNNRAIWALGLRNPFTTSFQNTTGRFFINDVQDFGPEVVQEGVAGANYGYPHYQGGKGNGLYPANSPGTLKLPVHIDAVHETGVCAITGASFYNATKVHNFPPKYRNYFFFMDYCGSWIHTLDLDNNYAVGQFATKISNPLDIKFSPVDGAMYYIAKQGGGNTSTTNGAVYKVWYGDSIVTSLKTTSQKALPEGWKLQMAHAGSLPWVGDAKFMDVHSVDGKILGSAMRGSFFNDFATLTVLPKDGVYLVHYR